MGLFLTIRALREEGLAKKAIARRLGLDPRTVRRYVRRIEAGATEPARARVTRKLDPWEAEIAALAARGLTAVQVYQELVKETACAASYETVRRRVRDIRPRTPTVYQRLDFRPGEEAQIDFGEVGRLRVGDGERRAYLFVMTLCYSRYAYYELVLEQRVPTFLGLIRRGLEFFGGSPRRLKPDNLRSAVLFSHLGERYYQEDFFRFCRHYGTLPDPARPGTPTDKGRTERDIRYAKGNAFRGRTFASFEAARAALPRWRDEVANVRVHGTTRRRPVDLFAEERPHLRALPSEPYEVCQIGQYRVRQDCHIHLEHNFYSVPYRFVGQRVLAKTSETRVVVLAHGAPVADHERARGRGVTVTDPAHYPLTKRTSTQEIHRHRVLRVRAAGPHSAEFLRRVQDSVFVAGDQVARLCRLLESHGADAVERACHRALHYGATQSAAIIERILRRGLERRPFLLAADPVPTAPRDFGRPLQEYSALLPGQAVIG